ncbi:ECF transporter S component [Tissierella sp. Yu-01]|uniref:ECF transporter S component n=1 Tax=Tissierella sp. Yu-01 TaxID=3035694 RepID=UPI00240E5053|nr:ECF transporter S component [Tissierella sp. Yu-01]WFA09372.1 ECF transporter S component [Tissierella sp. Yu-01]
MKAKRIVLSGLFVAIGILLPMIFHQFSMGGPAFLPMHIPVLIAGLFLGPIEGLMVGLITPILSSVLTGMPVMFPMLPIMVFELGTYGFTAGYFYKKLKMNLFVSLILSMLDGRISAGIVVFILGSFFGYQGAGPIPFIQGAIITGIPGIIIQIIFVPLVVKLLNKYIQQ